MADLTPYGTLWGAVPDLMGRVFFVAPAASYTLAGQTYSASDDHRGTDPKQALLTLARAVALCSANSDDVIVALPGTHTLAASLALSKAGVTLTGLPSGRRNKIGGRTLIVGPSADQAINVTAADVSILNLGFTCITAIACIDLSTNAERFLCDNCYFDMQTAAASTSTVGISALAAAERVRISDCVFQATGAQGNAIVATALLNSIIERCQFHNDTGTWASAILCGAATEGLLIKGCVITCSGTAITVGVNGTGASIASGVAVTDCRFGDLVTVPIDNFDAAECAIAENYSMGIGATDGGVLITAIT